MKAELLDDSFSLSNQQKTSYFEKLLNGRKYNYFIIRFNEINFARRIYNYIWGNCTFYRSHFRSLIPFIKSCDGSFNLERFV